ncbi:MAG: succinyl-diaminopimelate desuccinylase [Pseudomonadota bacterium]
MTSPGISALELAQALIRRPSVTPEDAGALDVLQAALERLGFACTRLPFEEEHAARVDNLYARRGDRGPNFCFAGHTDVVPPGDVTAWTRPPFEAAVEDGVLWGRGASDMKSAIAAFVAAAASLDHAAQGSISLLITGDEEGSAVNGTRKVLEWLQKRGERIDHCLVGEPTNPEAMGDMVKVGRRGSINCWLTVLGAQGHVAYPHRAKNPIPDLAHCLTRLCATPLDNGYDRFQPSSLQITDIHSGNPAHNVIPARAGARFNVRFNPNWTGAKVEAWLRDQLDKTAAAHQFAYELKTIVSGEAFLTTDDEFIDLVAQSVSQVTKRAPELSTSGGTSDARFIKDHAPVVEFGLVGATMHKVDERIAVSDIETLTRIYETILNSYFAKFGTMS